MSIAALLQAAEYLERRERGTIVNKTLTIFKMEKFLYQLWRLLGQWTLSLSLFHVSHFFFFFAATLCCARVYTVVSWWYGGGGWGKKKRKKYGSHLAHHTFLMADARREENTEKEKIKSREREKEKKP